MLIRCILSFLITFPICTKALNFPYENITLSDIEVSNNTLLSFGDISNPSDYPTSSTTGCRVYPTDSEWPSSSVWDQFNATLGGALIKGVPPALVCYEGDTYDEEKCALARVSYFDGTARANDPVSIENEWLDGDSCPAFAWSNVPGGNTTVPICDEMAYPAYVVDVTTVRQIQLAVNFARNTGIRLIVKNTGHDLRGQSAGSGSLSIWTHHLKGFTYLPSYTIGNYTGRAARVATGMQTSDLSISASIYNVTLVIPGWSTVGGGGGWFMGGGHGTHTSKLGLGADQVLSVEIVTPDGRFITAEPGVNEDLFWAVRGGGGGTWGVVTSVIVKAYDISNALSFSPSIAFSQGNFTGSVSHDVFWAAIRTYLEYVPQICDAGGTGFNYIYNYGGGFMTFTTSIFLPGMNYTQALAFANPLYLALEKAGLNTTQSTSMHTHKRSDLSREERGVQPGTLVNASPMPYPSRVAGQMNLRLSSRLFPRTHLEDPTLLTTLLSAIQSAVEEGGYTFHSSNHCPTLAAAGYPDNAILPAYRSAAMHAQLWDSGPAIGPIEIQALRYQRFQTFFQPWRDISVDGGSYMNEADPAEPGWQVAFWGESYGRLLSLKRQWDPWGLFWGKTAVGSEEWEVVAPFKQTFPTQNGPLCPTFYGLRNNTTS